MVGMGSDFGLTPRYNILPGDDKPELIERH
jgi:hypothetical protein